MRKQSLRNVAAVFSGGYDGKPSDLALMWDYDGARYHVWLETTPPHDLIHPVCHRKPVLFKNPPRDIPHHGKGYYATKHLDIAAKKNAEMISMARAGVDFDAALKTYLANEQQKDDANRRDREKQAFTERLNKAAPELFELAKDITRANEGFIQLGDIAPRAFALIREIEGE